MPAKNTDDVILWAGDVIGIVPVPIRSSYGQDYASCGGGRESDVMRGRRRKRRKRRELLVSESGELGACSDLLCLPLPVYPLDLLSGASQ